MKLVIFYFKRAYYLLENRDKLRIKVISVIQVLLGILDLVGVVFIGLLGALSISGVQSREPGTRVFTVLKILQLENLSFQTQTACLGGIAVTFLVVKTILSVLLTRRSLFFLSYKGAQISSRLIRDLLASERAKRECLRFLFRASVASKLCLLTKLTDYYGRIQSCEAAHERRHHWPR